MMLRTSSAVEKYSQSLNRCDGNDDIHVGKEKIGVFFKAQSLDNESC